MGVAAAGVIIAGVIYLTQRRRRSRIQLRQKYVNAGYEMQTKSEVKSST